MSLSGTIREADGRGALDVNVRVVSLDKAVPYDATFLAENGAWWIEEVPTGARYEVVASRGAWTAHRQLGPLGAYEQMVDVTIPADLPAPSASAAPLRALAPGTRPPCEFPWAKASIDCGFKVRPRQAFLSVHVPRTLKRGQPIHARLAMGFSDSCDMPYLDGCKAVVDDASRTVHFEAASAYESAFGCTQATWRTSIFVPFTLSLTGPWRVESERFDGNTGQSEPQTFDVQVVD